MFDLSYESLLFLTLVQIYFSLWRLVWHISSCFPELLMLWNQRENLQNQQTISVSVLWLCSEKLSLVCGLMSGHCALLCFSGVLVRTGECAGMMSGRINSFMQDEVLLSSLWLLCNNINSDIIQNQLETETTEHEQSEDKTCDLWPADINRSSSSELTFNNSFTGVSDVLPNVSLQAWSSDLSHTCHSLRSVVLLQ